jgi:hypothetical protein
MKIVMTLLVRNEADIVATNIEYHLRRGVDFIIATDNLSEDGTRDVLEHYRRRKLLHLILQQEDIFAQNVWVTQMARMASIDFQADWVINSDADEFWWPDESNNLQELFAAVPREIDALSVSRCNFLPVSHAGKDNFTEVMIVREPVARNALGEPLPPKICHRAYPDIEVAMGNHDARRSGGPMRIGHAPLTILHFPLRHFEHFSLKISLGGAAVERNADLEPGMVNTWRMLHKRWKRGELESYYRQQEIAAEEVEPAIAARRVLRDERLRDFMRQSHVGN